MTTQTSENVLCINNDKKKIHEELHVRGIPKAPVTTNSLAQSKPNIYIFIV